MKRSEIRTKIRYNIRETTAQVWANAELNYWINDVQKEVAIALHPNYNPKLIQIKTQVVSTGIASYDLPSDFLMLIGHADLNSESYVYTPPNLVRPVILDEYGYTASTKICYIRNNEINFHPTPTSVEDGMGAFYTYLTTPADFSDDATTDGELSDLAYNLVVDKVSGMALMKVDSEESQLLAKRFFEKYEFDIRRLNERAINDKGAIKTSD